MFLKIRMILARNKNKIILGLAITAFILLILYIINGLLIKNENKNEIKSSEKNNYIYDPNYAIISKGTISKETIETTSKLINDFMNFCNNKNLEEAYELISQDCKKEMFVTIDDFINKYYNKIFTNYKIYNSQLWEMGANVYTYKVRILDDMLSTGKDNQGKAVEDYFTIIIENGEYKLNINNYIKKEEINKENKVNNFSIEILNKQIYLEYEKYNIKITNNTGNIVLLDGFRNSNSIYLLDENDSKYMALKNEITEEMFKIYDKNTFEKTIKFYKRNDQNLEINSIIFSDIILNYEEYKQNEIIYKNVLSMKIDI